MSGQFETPWERWSRDSRQLFLSSPEALEEAFVLFLRRSPSNDGLVSIESVLYELPAQLRPRGRKKEPIKIQHWLLTDSYRVLVAERLVRIHPVDLEANARTPRGSGASREDEGDPEQIPSRSAADMAFDRDLGPVTDPDGGFTDPPLNPEESDP
ncbi:MAG: hypothetical protein JKY65_24310 [Planctomycetes bacterium]|nr:hypothetical protein [Planctomycetota bacterium]